MPDLSLQSIIENTEKHMELALAAYLEKTYGKLLLQERHEPKFTPEKVWMSFKNRSSDHIKTLALPELADNICKILAHSAACQKFFEDYMIDRLKKSQAQINSQPEAKRLIQSVKQQGEFFCFFKALSPEDQRALIISNLLTLLQKQADPRKIKKQVATEVTLAKYHRQKNKMLAKFLAKSDHAVEIKAISKRFRDLKFVYHQIIENKLSPELQRFGLNYLTNEELELAKKQAVHKGLHKVTEAASIFKDNGGRFLALYFISRDLLKIGLTLVQATAEYGTFLLGAHFALTASTLLMSTALTGFLLFQLNKNGYSLSWVQDFFKNTADPQEEIEQVFGSLTQTSLQPLRRPRRELTFQAPNKDIPAIPADPAYALSLSKQPRSAPAAALKNPAASSPYKRPRPLPEDPRRSGN